MKAEQRYDLIAELDWELCPQQLWSCFKHCAADDTPLGWHYDTPLNSVGIRPLLYAKLDGKYVVAPIKRRRGEASYLT